MMNEKKVSIIIPTYNRGHLLKRTIPTYLQDNVGEIILIDDMSTDNTEKIINELKSEINEIKYIKLTKKCLQVGAKNRGISEAKFEYVYFGDDDSILSQGSIKKLLKVISNDENLIVGAKALYMEKEKDIYNIEEYIQKKNKITNDITKIIDLKRMNIDFSYSTKFPIELPFVQACFLAKLSKIKNIKYDINYKGNCYREETDFLLCCRKKGMKIYYCSDAIQINYPRSLSSGGAHQVGKIKWYYWTIKNNLYFLKKNINYLKKEYGVTRNIYIYQYDFILIILSKLIKNFIKRRIKDN